MPKSELEDELAWQMRVAGLPEPECHYKFAKSIGRKWESDFVWPDRMLIVEVEGFGHHRLNRYWGDVEKYNAATEMGYRLYRVTTAMVDSGEALTLIERVLA